MRKGIIFILSALIYLLTAQTSSAQETPPFCPMLPLCSSSPTQRCAWVGLDENISCTSTCGEAGRSWPYKCLEPYLLDPQNPNSYVYSYSCCTEPATDEYLYPTPTPTPSGPEPFLDLPWDYEGMSFRDAALAITSYFDHEYPFMDKGWAEPDYAQDTLTNFEGIIRSLELDYSSHDGYDWGKPANVFLGDTVFSAAPGIASFHLMGTEGSPCGTRTCGNTIVIDHGNGYQTRYYHLQEDDPVSQSFATPRYVNRGEPIGKVGATGGWDVPHIHFSVIQDRNGNGDFQDDRPYGFTDPFGWFGAEDDPWEIYESDDGLETGNKSHYLWAGDIFGFSGNLTRSEQNRIDSDKFSYSFPENSFEQDVVAEEKGAPAVRFNNLVSIGSASEITIVDASGNQVTNPLVPFELSIDFGSYDLSNVNTNTLSIYSSNDGVNWVKENTIIDWINKKATAFLDHFSYYALMAERIDTIAPTTTADLTGDEGESGWFNDEVLVTLDPQDNEGGLGVYYTGYQVDGDYFREYKEPFTVSGEGDHIVEFYSVDNDGNIEEVKSIEFHIEETMPEAIISMDPDTLDTVITGTKEGRILATDLGNGRKSVTIFDKAENYIELVGSFDIDGESDSVFIEQVNYSNGISENYILASYQTQFKKDGQKRLINLTQTWYIYNSGRLTGINLNYKNNPDFTKIIIKDEGEEKVVMEEAGMRLLKITTNAGNLDYSY